jgi:heme-degrading monooxygenase HmoA
MRVRATTLEGDPTQLDEAADWVRETVVPLGDDAPGHRGVLLVADRATGRSTTFTFWDSADDMRASEEHGQRLRAAGTSELDARVVDVNRYEILLDERHLPSDALGYVRITTLRGDPARIDDALVYLREKVRPVADGLDGSRGMLALADRANGTDVTLTFWETAEAMRTSEDVADQLRGDAAATLEMDLADVQRYEVLIDERR